MLTDRSSLWLPPETDKTDKFAERGPDVDTSALLA
jgi:hypothetical protein